MLDINGAIGYNYPSKSEAIAMKDKDRKIINDLGNVAAAPEHLRVETVRAVSGYLGGKAAVKECEMVATIDGGECSFPFTMVIPRREAKSIIVYIRKSEMLSADLPIEMIVDSDVAMMIIEADTIENKKRLQRVLYRGSRSKLKTAKTLAWCAERLVDLAVCREEFSGMPISVVGSGDRCAALLALGLSDDRVNRIVLAMPSLMDSAESDAISHIEGSITDGIQADDIVILDSNILVGEGVADRLLPPGIVKRIPISARHLGMTAWRAILENL